MTTRKAFVIKVEFEIQAVTCPGVWLCSNGKVSLQIYMLDCCVQTASIKPSFPMLFHEQFVFSKTLPTKYVLDDLKKQLSKEWLYVELIQWETCDSGNVLAFFQIPVNELLYPSTCNGYVSTGEIDLLMETTPIFPGAIAPKLEVSTRTTIDETVCSCIVPAKNSTVVPKLFSTNNKSKYSRNKEVCHVNYSCRTRKPKGATRCVPRCRSMCRDPRPPFRYKKIEDGFLERRNQWHDINGPRSQQPPMNHEDCPCSNPYKDYKDLQGPTSAIYCPKDIPCFLPGHLEQVCTVCQKYSGLFKNKMYYNANVAQDWPKDNQHYKAKNIGPNCPTHCEPWSISQNAKEPSIAKKMHQRITKTLNSIPKYWDDMKQACREGKSCMADVCQRDDLPDTMPDLRRFYRDLYSDKNEEERPEWRNHISC